MAPNPRVVAAYRAMSNLGIHESKVKPVLKKLLKLYDKKWELIEEESYRALADAIFEEDETKVAEPEQNNKNNKDGEVNGEDAHLCEEPLRPLKRLRLRSQEGTSSCPMTSNGTSSAAFELKTPKLEDGLVPESSSRQQPQSIAALSDGNARVNARHVPPQDAVVDKGKQPVSPQVTPRGRRSISDRSHFAETAKEPTVEPGATSLANNKMPHLFTFITPKDEPVDDMPDYEIPIAVIHPEPSNGGDDLDAVVSQCRDEAVEGEDILPFSNEEATSNGDVELSSMEEERSVKITHTDDVSKESETNGSPIVGGNKDSVLANGSISSAMAAPQVPCSVPCSSDLDDAVLASKMVGMNDFLQIDGGKELDDAISPNSHTLVVAPKCQLTTDDARPRAVHDVNDLSKGEERVKVSWLNNTTNDSPPPFHYIPRNLVFRDAYVNISLSRIGNEDCCSTCMGNCVLSFKPCTCTNKTGCEFAYTAQGLLKEEFLEECIAISRDPQNYFYCKSCPLERSKDDDCLEPCKGHMKRKFIKECWSKCGCTKHCGNRVVQRGITCNLQVFFTTDGKGWGLRTLEDLPKGTFVCEFVGEILTVKELNERNMKYPKNGKYTYPILLDADWGSGVVKDREALCLYAASYGNAARFINHRCLDANLIEIPVEVEGPAHHYYHFAFFTSRKIAAQEELTWDYGINFDDHDQSVELFQCRCGSKFCRNIKRSNRSMRSSIA